MNTKKKISINWKFQILKETEIINVQIKQNHYPKNENQCRYNYKTANLFAILYIRSG